MVIINVGFNHCHDADFIIDRPEGSGDNLLLLTKTDAIFTLDGRDVLVPKDSIFIYRKGRPQFYRCKPGCPFSNDWVHFLFEGNEEERFLSLGLGYEMPIKLTHPYFASFCIRSVSTEVYSSHIHARSNMDHYMFLLFNHVSDQLSKAAPAYHPNAYEMLSTVRTRMYSSDYHFFGSSRFIVEREARNSNDGQAIVERGRATKESLCGIVCFLLCQPFSQRLISL